VLLGYDMIYGRDYEKTASPSADMIMWRAMNAIAMMIRWEERRTPAFDVPTAYLNAKDRQFRGFMYQPPGLEEPGTEGQVYELGTYLYGEPPAGLAWYQEMKGVLAKKGYKSNLPCPSLFSKVTRKQEPYAVDWYSTTIRLTATDEST
jgi:hypothetical protein